MASRIVGSATVLVMVLVLGSVLLGCGAAEAQPAAPQASAGKTNVAIPVKPFTNFGDNRCTQKADYANPPGGGKDQAVRLEVTEQKLLMDPSPHCAKESAKGSLTFQVGAYFPDGHVLEVDFVPIEINGIPRKGPHKKTGGSANPVEGRCKLTKPNDFCKFQSTDHHSKTDVPNDIMFFYNIILYDSAGKMVDAVDPGIMVTDNP